MDNKRFEEANKKKLLIHQSFVSQKAKSKKQDEKPEVVENDEVETNYENDDNFDNFRSTRNKNKKD